VAERSVVVRLGANVTGFVAGLKGAGAAARDLARDLGAVDKVRLGDDGYWRDAKGRFAKGGTSAGSAFASAFGTAAKAGMIAGLGTSAGGLVTGLAVAIPGAAGAATAALATVAMATRGVGDAMSALAEGDAEEIQEALEKLSPSARSFAHEGRAVAQEWGGVQDAVQEAMFRPLLGDLEQLTRAYLPSMKRDLPAVADAWGRAGDRLADWASGADTVAQVRTIVQGTVPVVDDLGRSVENLADFWTTVGAESMPVVQRLGQMVENLTGGMRRWAEEAERSGQLGDLFAETEVSVGLLEESVTNLGSALGDVFANPNTVAAANTLLEVLASGTGTVAAIAEAFASLPPGLQQFILVAGTAAFAASKLSGGITALSANLGKVEPNANRASRALNLLSNAGNLAGTALVAGALGQFISQQTGGLINGRAGDVDKLQQSLIKLGETGKVTGELAEFGGIMGDLTGRVTGTSDSIELFTGALITSESWLGKASIWFDNLAQYVGVPAGQATQTREQLEAIDQALAGLVTSGRADEAKAAFDKIARAAMDQGKSMEWVKQQFAAYQAALEQNPNTGPAEQAQQRLALQARLLSEDFNKAAASVGGLKTAFDILNGEALSGEEIAQRWEAALDGIGAAADRFGTSLNRGTEAGRANRQALVEAITAAQDYADANNLSAGQVEALRQSILRQATAAGYSKTEVEALLDQLFQIPGQYNANVATPGATKSDQEIAQLHKRIQGLRDRQVQIRQSGAPNAQSQVAALDREIKGLQNRIVTIRVVQIRETIGVGGLAGRRWGGIDYHMARGGAVEAHWTTAPTILYGERETGGEAFIPRLGDYQRSMDILQKAASWYGAAVVPNVQRDRPLVGRVAAAAPVAGGLGEADVVRLVTREVGRAVATGLAGARVVLDDRTVGRIEGRRGDLIARGG
jgi:polyhydroxyalkanoate synthesis regulator phasin